MMISSRIERDETRAIADAKRMNSARRGAVAIGVGAGRPLPTPTPQYDKSTNSSS